MNDLLLIPLQAGLPEWIPSAVAIGGTIVLFLMVIAFGAFVYRSLTGGIEWPSDKPEDDDSLREGDPDDEWDYY